MKRLSAGRAISVGVVILAAGRSARMGKPKLLLPWGGSSVLGHLIGEWEALGAKQIAVVCAPGDPAQISPAQVAADGSRHCLPCGKSAPTAVGGYAVSVGDARSETFKPAIQAELDRLGFPARNRIINPAPERGMFSSIQCAAQWPGWEAALTHWAIVLGDQPHLQPQTLRQVLAFSAAHPAKVCQPARHGHRRHPVLLPKAVFHQVAVSTAATLKEFLVARPGELALCELDDPGLELDINRPEDYDKALNMAAKRSARR
jgi:molybdenum cofactor cytidylyltransferase